MANENNGVFTDLLIAVGAPIQNVADAVGNGVNSAFSIAQSGIDLCSTIVSSTANTAIQLIQGVTTGITAAITPKK
jgi:chlorosome envelope protein F